MWLSWERICLQWGRPGFDPWVGKIPWRKERPPTLVFCSGESHGLYRPWGRKELERLSDLHFHFHFMGCFARNKITLYSYIKIVLFPWTFILQNKTHTHTHTHTKSEITKCYNHTVSTPLRIFGPPPPPTTPFRGAQPPHHSIHWWWRSKYRQRDTGSSSFWHTNHERHQSHGEPTRVSWMLKLTEAWHTYN